MLDVGAVLGVFLYFKEKILKNRVLLLLLLDIL